VCFAAQVHAVDPHRLISQYSRERWGREQGFPGGSVSAIAQTTDGYLWIGTEKGLLRFDGLNFRVFQQAIPGSFSIGPVRGLLTDAEGNLWVLLEGTKILRYHDGKFELGHHEAEFGVTAIGRRANGMVLLSSLAFGALTYSGGRFQILSPPASELPDSAATATAETNDILSSRLSWATSVASHRLAEPNSAVISMSETSDGKLWLGTRDKGLFYMIDGRVSAVAKGRPSVKITCLLPLENGKMWVGTENGVVLWNGAELTQTGVPSSLRHTGVLAMIRDRDSNIWVGTAGGLLRVNGEGVSFDGSRGGTSEPVTALFEDREGNVWVGRPQGIERLRETAFVTYSAVGPQSESSGPIYVDQEGRAWFAPFEGGLRWLKGVKSGSVTHDHLSQDVVYSIAGSKNELWIGRQRGGLTQLRYGDGPITTKTYTQTDGLAQNGVYAVYQSRDGSVWAATLSGGVSRFKEGRFVTYTSASGLSSNTVYSIIETRDGTTWFATSNGLNSWSAGQWRTYTSREGFPSDNVNCLFEDSAGVLWIGTANGIGFINSGGIQAPREVPESLREQIFGIEEDKTGSLWIATSSHVLRVNRDKLLRLVVSDADVRDYGSSDGLRSAEGIKRNRSVVVDSLGRIWFSMSRGLSVVDPSHLTGNSAPAIAHVETISADGSAINIGDTIRVPASHKRITFSYAGLSLAVPERVRFRYFLDGFDRTWSEPTAAREAVYTNLSPGSYRFRVIASNSDGVWNSSESTLPFEIDPLFWQTWWFRLSSILTIGLAILMFFRLRVLRLTKQMNMRFEERLAERTRIAQGLHDTLLQGFLSASMQLHVADDHLATDSPAKPFVGRVLELMGQVIEEGRNAVRGLRSSKLSSADLEQAFSQIRQEFPVQSQIEFRVIVEGAPRPLRPVIRDEVYLIGHEALSNAFRHSHASDIEVELEYAASHLRVLVRDNGGGIDTQVLRSGREGHWGLSGMKERTERIGGELRVLSRAVAGTEVELSVPGQIAFEFRSDECPAGWLSRLYRGKRRNEKSRSGSEQPR